MRAHETQYLARVPIRAAAVATLVCACAGAAHPGRPARGGSGASSTGDSRTVTAAALVAVGDLSALEAVRRLRPEFLRGSGRAASLSGLLEIGVYLDGVYAGGASALDAVSASDVSEIRFLHPTEARFLHGAGCRCGNGAITVSTRRPAPR